MTTRATRGLAMAVLFAMLVVLAIPATPVEAAGRQAPTTTWYQGVTTAARLWLGELLGLRGPAPRGDKAGLATVSGADEVLVDEDGNPIPPQAAGIFKLKQHVDNPSNTPM